MRTACDRSTLPRTLRGLLFRNQPCDERIVRRTIHRQRHRPDTTVTRAAEELGIGRATLHRKIAQYKITVPRATG